jgi:hypothetical protein
MKSSSIFKLSFYSYSNAYELEYSCHHVIIMIYELAYSLDILILTYSTPCLNIDMMSMSRSRVRLRWQFVGREKARAYLQCIYVKSNNGSKES